MAGLNRHAGFNAIEVLIIALAIGFVGVSGWLAYQHNKPQSTAAEGGTKTAQSNTNQETTTQPTTKTYISGQEGAMFKYPSTWKVTKSYQVSNDPSNTDYVGIESPSGAITISYVTDISGFGDEHTASYPLNTVIDKTAITKSPGLYVISGTTTLDGTTYYPWIAVQDSNGILANGVQGNVVTFTANHALNLSTRSAGQILFATCGARTNQNSPSLTQAQATAWFSDTEAQQAKQILLSFTDAQ